VAVHVGRRGPAHQARVAAAAPSPGGGPDPFAFADASSAALATAYESGTIVVSGLDAPANLSIAGGEYTINGGAWATSATTVSNGDVVKVRGTSSVAVATSVEVVLTIGGVSAAFTITSFANAEASALALRFTTDPGEVRRGLIDNCIGALKGAGVWAKLDVLCLLAAHDAQAAQRNWIQDAFNLTPVNGPLFEVDRGYVGDVGAQAHLDTGFNDLTGSALWTQDTLSLGAYINQYAGGSNGFLGLTSGAGLRLGASTTNIAARIHSSTSFSPAFASSSPGHLVITRGAATSSRCLRNGVSVGTSSVGSAAGADANVVAFRSVTSYNADRMACLHIGGFLTPAEVAGLYDAILAYLTALGAA